MGSTITLTKVTKSGESQATQTNDSGSHHRSISYVRRVCEELTDVVVNYEKFISKVELENDTRNTKTRVLQICKLRLQEETLEPFKTLLHQVESQILNGIFLYACYLKKNAAIKWLLYDSGVSDGFDVSRAVREANKNIKSSVPGYRTYRERLAVIRMLCEYDCRLLAECSPQVVDSLMPDDYSEMSIGKVKTRC